MLKKTFVKTLGLRGFYVYEIYLINAGGDIWYEADPKTPGCVTRTANTEAELKIILLNDVDQIIKFQQKVR